MKTKNSRDQESELLQPPTVQLYHIDDTPEKEFQNSPLVMKQQEIENVLNLLTCNFDSFSSYPP